MGYNNGNIYQILNHVNDDVYVGSTKPLSKLLYEHNRTVIILMIENYIKPCEQ